jgi:hypothetical protein
LQDVRLGQFTLTQPAIAFVHTHDPAGCWLRSVPGGKALALAIFGTPHRLQLERLGQLQLLQLGQSQLPGGAA